MIKLYKSSILFLTTTVVIVFSMSCNDILETPEEKEWLLSDLQSTSPKDIIDCLGHLTKAKLALPVAQYIWDVMVKFYDGVTSVPVEKLSLLHWASVALKPEDFYNITLNNIEVIENFGFNYNLNPAQLDAIANRVREDWGGKEPEDYSYYDLVALRQILCAFNRSEIERIRPSAYKEASITLGKLQNCDPEVLQGFATLAVQKSAFGLPSKWNDGVWEMLGVVADYLPKGAKSNTQKPANSSKENN